MKYVKILDLQNGILADRLSAALSESNIPHVIRSMHDTAYNGVYQAALGWGWVEAPEEERERIIEIFDDIVRTSEPDDSAMEEIEARPTEPREAPGEREDRGRLGVMLFIVFIGLLVSLIRNSWGPRPGRGHRLGSAGYRHTEFVFTRTILF